PVRFDNLVWFSDQELREKLHASVPLFDGQLPVAGSLVDQVSEASQALLLERNVQARANYLRFAPRDGPIEAFVFSVDGIRIRIHDIQFEGVGPDQLPSLEAIARRLQGQDYSRSALRIQGDKNFLPVYFERGYLKASFSDAQPKVVEDSSQETLVDVTFAVDPGRQYKATEMELSGYQVLTLDKLRELIRQKMGQPVNAVQLENDLEAIEKLYG